METETTPLLLARLQAQIDTDEGFAFAVKNTVGDISPSAFRALCQKIFSDLYDTAAAYWTDLLYPDEGWEPELRGIAIVERYPELHSCWLDDFSKAIVTVANAPDTGKSDTAFLYFMLGFLRCGWEEYVRRSHGDKLQFLHPRMVFDNE